MCSGIRAVDAAPPPSIPPPEQFFFCLANEITVTFHPNTVRRFTLTILWDNSSMGQYSNSPHTVHDRWLMCCVQDRSVHVLNNAVLHTGQVCMYTEQYCAAYRIGLYVYWKKYYSANNTVRILNNTVLHTGKFCTYTYSTILCCKQDTSVRILYNSVLHTE